jgi:hypothetical protein
MNTILIHYELHGANRDYDALYQRIMSCGSWCHVHESLWLVKTEKTAAQVRNHVRSVLRQGDQVITIDVTGRSWATNYTNEQTDWMHENI